MFWLKRMLALGSLLCAVPACAFTFSYGNLFDVKDVKNEGGVLQLPLSGGKYKNVKILEKDVYDFLLQCKTDCRYLAESTQFVSVDYRQAFTNERMLIADVDFNNEVTLTFLVFKNKDSFSVKAPQEAVFKDKKLQKQVKKYLIRLAEKNL